MREIGALSNSRNKHFISADELSTHQNDPQWVFVDCRFDLMRPGAGRQAYDSGHIPGAVYADLDRDLAAPVADDGTGGRHPLPDPYEFSRLLSSWGVGPNSVVVAYDNSGSAVAARLWWLLRWLGHERVAVLDGGLDAWVAAAGPLSTETPKPTPSVFEPHPGSMPVIDAGGIADGLTNRDFLLMDARDVKRFNGRSEPIDSIAGHIPGAFNTPYLDNLGADKCFRPLTEINAYYRARIGDRSMESVLHVRFGCNCLSHVAGFRVRRYAGCRIIRWLVERLDQLRTTAGGRRIID